MNSAEECIKDGYKYYCMNCFKAYKEIPTEWHDEVSCTGADLEMCRCGSDLFDTFENFIKREKEKEEKEKIERTVRSDLLDIEK